MSYALIYVGEVSPAVSVGKFLREQHEDELKAKPELGPYGGDAGLDDILVRIQAISDARRREMLFKVSEAYGSLDESASSANKKHAVVGEYLKATVAQLKVGDKVLDGLKDDDVEAIINGGFFLELFLVARDYQRLSAGKKNRFG
jgi:hypothetical protein